MYKRNKIMYFTLEIENPDKLFFTSDTHFGHYNICRYCERPYGSRSEMDNALIDNWNRVVPEDGVVVHCGDFMLPHDHGVKEYTKYLNKLTGRVLLLRGNHDRIPLLTETDKLISVQDIAIISVDGVRIHAQHCPVLANFGDYHVFGHVHTMADGTCYGVDGDINPKLRPTQYDVGVDQNGYRPIGYWDLIKIFKKRRKTI